MEFVLNSIKYQISNLEVFVAYLIVDKYFRNCQYDIHFDFLDEFDHDLTFEELTKGADLIEDLNPNFINPNFIIQNKTDGKFRISYHQISFDDIYAGEAISVLICLNSLIELKPAVTLDEIKQQVDTFIKTQRKKFITQ